MRPPLASVLFAVALVLGAAAAVAQTAPPAVEWEFVGPDSALVPGFALVDPVDGRPHGLPDRPFASVDFPFTPTFYGFEDGVYQLDDPVGGPPPPVDDPAWTLTGSRTTGAHGVYADVGGLVLASINGGPNPLTRSTDGGVTWNRIGIATACRASSSNHQIVRTYGPGRERALWIVRGLCRSDDDGATWAEVTESSPSLLQRRDLLELPVSAALPEGRLLLAVGSGVLASDNSGRDWRATSLYQEFRWVGNDLELVADPTHPYGGTVMLTATDFFFTDGAYATVLASDDGGDTWEVRSRFANGSHGLQTIRGDVQIEAHGDGSLVAGLVGPRVTSENPLRSSGAMVWSGDGGRTWSDLGGRAPWLGAKPPAGACGSERGGRCPGGAWPGWGPGRVEVDREGRVWTATDNGVWRTTGPTWASVDSEDAPRAGGVSLAVYPNPTASRATVEVSGWEALRIVIVDAIGREVASWDGASRIEVDTSEWAPGAYMVRVTGPDGASASVGLAVAR